MHPAFSVIFLSTLIGVGQGLFLALFTVESYAAFDLLPPQSSRFYALGSLVALGFLVAGLVASFFHLGHPERAWRSAAKWRTSWLSREVIVLPAFMGLVFLYGAAHFLNYYTFTYYKTAMPEQPQNILGEYPLLWEDTRNFLGQLPMISDYLPPAETLARPHLGQTFLKYVTALEVLPLLRDLGPLTIPEIMDQLGLVGFSAQGKVVMALDSLIRQGSVEERPVPAGTPQLEKINVRKYALRAS